MRVDVYKNYDQLALEQREGIDYRILNVWRDSKVLVMAPHGGGIEPGTSEVAWALAGERYSLYCFEGVKAEGNSGLHLASIVFNESICEAMLRDARLVVVVHGCMDQQPIVYVGGLCHELAQVMVSELCRTGFTSLLDETHHSGHHPESLCNRSRSGKGLQLELSLGLRRTFFTGLDRQGRKTTTPAFDLFTRIVRERIDQYCDG